MNLWVQPLLDSYMRHLKNDTWLALALFISSCAFWLACAAFAGLCAAFFWRDLDLNLEAKLSVTLRSVVLTWAPTMLLCCMWVILWIPYLAYLAVFRMSVDRGIIFWNSKHPREWIGDFSELESPDSTKH